MREAHTAEKLKRRQAETLSLEYGVPCNTSEILAAHEALKRSNEEEAQAAVAQMEVKLAEAENAAREAASHFEVVEMEVEQAMQQREATKMELQETRERFKNVRSEEATAARNEKSVQALARNTAAARNSFYSQESLKEAQQLLKESKQRRTASKKIKEKAERAVKQCKKDLDKKRKWLQDVEECDPDEQRMLKRSKTTRTIPSPANDPLNLEEFGCPVVMTYEGIYNTYPHRLHQLGLHYGCRMGQRLYQQIPKSSKAAVEYVAECLKRRLAYHRDYHVHHTLKQQAETCWMFVEDNLLHGVFVLAEMQLIDVADFTVLQVCLF